MRLTRNSAVTRIVAAVVWVAGLATPPAVLAVESFDVIGLRPGMTFAEARKVLQSHGVLPVNIHSSQLSFAYSDGVELHRTPEFLHQVTASKEDRDGARRRQDMLVLHFSPPPDGERLVAVERTLVNYIDPVTTGQLKQSLLAKYGQPDSEVRGTFNWKQGGTRNCLSPSPDGIGTTLPKTDRGRSQSILEVVFVGSGSGLQIGRFRSPKVTRLEDCASMVEYRIGGSDDQPATRVNATMVAVEPWVKAAIVANEELERLRQAAVQKRLGKGGSPAL